jgi:hypothetical protein
MNYSNNDEVNDEIEACLSVYDLLEVNKGSNDSIMISLQCFPRTAESTSICFVSLNILITLSKDYPIKHPIIKISNSCGLSDEGKSIIIGINDLISTLIPGDPILFQIFEYIIDSLDESNGGECLICTESLIPTSSNNKLEKSVPTDEYSLCTPCSHTFHVSCLTKWGAICLETKELGKEAKAAKVIDDVKIKTLEGEVRGKLIEIEKWELIIVKLEEENEKYNNILNSKNEIEKNNNNYLPVTSKIPILRAKLSLLIQKESKLKDKNNLQYELKLLQQEIQKEELIESEIANKEFNNENNDIERLISSTTSSLNEAVIKLEREKKRYKKCQEELKISEISTFNKKESSMLNREIPCPCCRTTLLEKYCLSSSRKDNLFSTLLDNAINEKEENEKNGFTIENYSSSSVLLLPIKLIDIVRQIQQQQEQVYKSLKSNKNSLNEASGKIIEKIDNSSNNERIDNNNNNKLEIKKKNKK